MAEWLNALVSKTGMGATSSRVRIPPSPQKILTGFLYMKYLALLRGINVSEQKIIKMKELADALSKAGFNNVRTYIQSGNVIFDSSKKSNSALSKDVSKVIFNSFGHDVDVIVCSQKELTNIIEKAPFKKKDLGKKLYVSFLAEKPDVERTKLIKSLSTASETFVLNGTAIYTTRDPKLPFDKTVLGVLDKKIKMTITTRNWNVVNKISELMQTA